MDADPWTGDEAAGLAPPGEPAGAALAGRVWSDRELAEVLMRYGDRLRRIAGRVLRGPDRDDAVEDVLQDAFLRARAALGATRPADEAALGAWLGVIVYRLALDAVRRQRRAAHAAERLGRVAATASRGEGADADPEAMAVEAVARDETAQAVRAVLQHLPAAHRRILLLAARMPVGEVAATLGCTAGAVRARLARAREAYRLAMHADGAGRTLSLAARRRRVADLLAAGWAPPAIAQALGVALTLVYSDVTALARQQPAGPPLPLLFGEALGCPAPEALTIRADRPAAGQVAAVPPPRPASLAARQPAGMTTDGRAIGTPAPTTRQLPLL